MLAKNQYIMHDQAKSPINDIMRYDLTWRQKKINFSMHLSIFCGLSVISLVSQVL